MARKAKRAAKSKPAGKAKVESQGGQADRSLLLADAERLQDFDHAGRVRPAVQFDPGEHFQGRAVQAGLPENLTEQPHAGDRRSGRPGRQADLDLRVRRDPAISRPQDRQVLSARRAHARRGRSMAVLADGRHRADGGAGASLQELRGRNADLRDQPLHQRGQPALRRDEHAPQGPRLHRRQLFDRRHGDRRLGQWLGAAGPGHQRVSQPQGAGSRP